MPFFACTVNEIGPAADGTETAHPVIYINLTDTGGSFVKQWFHAAEDSKAQMLSVGLAANRGALLHTVHGWDAHDSTGARIGSYPEDQAAVKKLRFIATEHST